jgi:2',3'-cyclic-nucleotide 2'-phosphodiesterase (5'-nucleotidase family)
MSKRMKVLTCIPLLTVALGFRPAPANLGFPTFGRQQVTAGAIRGTTQLYLGGRVPKESDNLKNNEESWTPMPCEEDEARLTVIQITDTYTLEHLASVKTLVKETKEKAKGSKVIAMMTGDFLAPYLLSSVDRGFGMMNALAKIPIDYVCWGNHVSP